MIIINMQGLNCFDKAFIRLLLDRAVQYDQKIQGLDEAQQLLLVRMFRHGYHYLFEPCEKATRLFKLRYEL